MNIKQLRSVHQARPFQPFTPHLADGRTLEVPRMKFLSHSPNGRTVIVYEQDDSFSIVDVLLVTRLQVHMSNGAAKGDETADEK